VSYPNSYIVGTGKSFLGVKLSGRETDNLSLANLGVNNEWGYTSTPSIYLHSVHWDNFNFACMRASQFLIRDFIYDNFFVRDFSDKILRSHRGAFCV
jgi:hypothetical protein